MPGAVTHYWMRSKSLQHHNNFEFRMPSVADAPNLPYYGREVYRPHNSQGCTTCPARLGTSGRGDSASALVLETAPAGKDQPDERLSRWRFCKQSHTRQMVNWTRLYALGDALMLAEPDGFCADLLRRRAVMAQLLSDAMAQGMMPGYVSKLLAVFEEKQEPDLPSPSTH